MTSRSGARPMCRPDGTYAPVQCHSLTGYCWCVTPQGRPLPDTSMKSKKPKCEKLVGPGAAAHSTRSGQKRRASPNWKQSRPAYDETDDDGGTSVANRHRNTCDRAEKSKFNTNLIDNFKIEYRRTNISADGIGKRQRKKKT